MWHGSTQVPTCPELSVLRPPKACLTCPHRQIRSHPFLKVHVTLVVPQEWHVQDSIFFWVGDNEGLFNYLITDLGSVMILQNIIHGLYTSVPWAPSCGLRPTCSWAAIVSNRRWLSITEFVYNYCMYDIDYNVIEEGGDSWTMELVDPHALYFSLYHCTSLLPLLNIILREPPHIWN